MWPWDEEQLAREQARREKRTKQQYRVERCPVCKVSFKEGRMLNERKSWHCDECRATFTFHPFEYTPTSLVDSQVPKTCHCPSCQAREEQKKHL